MKIRNLHLAPLFLASLLTFHPGHAQVDEIIETFHDASDPRILIMAHRGGYLEEPVLPENSIPAIERALAAGMDIIETDFYLTSDGHMVAMHDWSLDRTTDGTGAVSDHTLAEVQQLRLRLPDGTLTDEYPPSLEEVVALVKGRAMLILDKVNVANDAQMEAVLRVLREQGAVDHALFHGTHLPAQAMDALARIPEDINFLPQRTDTSAEEIITILETLEPPGIELIFEDDQTPMLSPEVIATAQETDTRIWINSLWANQNGGHNDARAIAGEEDETWGWIADRGALIINCDYPMSLESFLEERDGRAMVTTHDFAPSDTEGWTPIAPAYSDGGYSFYPTANTFGGRILWSGTAGAEGGVIVTDFQGNADWRARAHPSAILRSPPFTLKGTDPRSPISSEFPVEQISFSLLGGMGAAEGPSAFSDIPEQSVRQSREDHNGWLGVALRRESDDEYLLWARRSANGQSNLGPGWQNIRWNHSTLAKATAGDPPGTTYTLDLIDAAHNDWGWIALDRVRFRLDE